MTHDKSDVMKTLVTMIDEVLGDNLFDIVAATSFRDDLSFQSIQFIALAAAIQERYDDIDFVAWLTAMEQPQVLALRVGDLADFIVTSALTP